MRADAVRNRSQIRASAASLVAAHGVDVSMQAIAVDPNVAVGTLYCHYATKADLIAAVLEDSAEHIASLAEAGQQAVAAGAEPGLELASVLHKIAALSAESQALRAVAQSLGVVVQTRGQDVPPSPGSPLARTFAAFDSIVDAACTAGSLGPDVTRRDLSVLLHGVFELQLDACSRDRYVDLVLAALAPPKA